MRIETIEIRKFKRFYSHELLDELISFIKISESALDTINRKICELSPKALANFKELFDTRKTINSDAGVKRFLQELDIFYNVYEIFNLPLDLKFDFNNSILRPKRDDIPKIPKPELDDLSSKLKMLNNEAETVLNQLKTFLKHEKAAILEDFIQISDVVRSLLGEMRFVIENPDKSRKLSNSMSLIRRFNEKFAEAERMAKEQTFLDAFENLKRFIKNVEDVQNRFHNELKITFKLA